MPEPRSPSPSNSESRRRHAVLVAGLLAILGWQAVFFTHGDPQTKLATPYKLTASSGVLPWQPEFVYFLYYLNLYPVASISTSPREYSVAGARRLMAEEGGSLVMDRYWTIRYGDLAKTYLYMPHVLLRGRPVKPRMLHANALGFTVALLALFTACWAVGRTSLGVILVALMGSNPFQVNVVYANNNLFGWPITFTLLLLALHIPLMRAAPPRMAVAVTLAVSSGILLGTFRQIRTEPTLVMAAAALVYLTVTRLRLWRRLVLVSLLAATFGATTALWRAYFEHKWYEASRAVSAAGGHVYVGPRHSYHFFWHALWCGLGDFDQKYGYLWSDVGAFSYAWPFLQKGYRYDPAGFPPTRPDEWDPLTLGVYWDKDRVYARTNQEVPEYIEIVRDKVLRDVTHDPLWYARILGRRVVRILSESTPPTLAAGNGHQVSLPGRLRWGLLAMALMLVLLWRRDWFHVKLVAFTLPLAGTALLVYSGGGTPLYSVAHLAAFAVLVVLAWEALRAGQIALIVLIGSRLVSLPPRARERMLTAPRIGSAPLSTARAWRTPCGRALAAAAAAVVLAAGSAAALISFAARHAPGPRGTLEPKERPRVAVLRFDNETQQESLAWVGDLMGDLLTDAMIRAGIRVFGPDAVELMEADQLWWGPYGQPNAPRQLGVNIAADRSFANRLVAGRIRQQDGLQACVEVVLPGPGARAMPEYCVPLDPRSPSDACWRLAERLGNTLGSRRALECDAMSGDAYQPYIEARRATRFEMWGEALRTVEDALGREPRLTAARVLQARIRARWAPLEAGVLQGLADASTAAEALTALQERVRAAPESVDARMDLGRLLAGLELFEDAHDTLRPMFETPGAPPEAFGVLATVLSARGELDRAYQALLEYERRSWQEPRGHDLMADHFVRWGAFELAKRRFGNAESTRAGRGLEQFTLEHLARQWDLCVLEQNLAGADDLAWRMAKTDDPRAAGYSAAHLARGHLLRGRSQLAATLSEESIYHDLEHGLEPATAVREAAHIRILRGEAAAAVERVRAARDLRTMSVGPEFEEAIALARLGRWSEATDARRSLARALKGRPGPTGPRLLARLDGELSLLRGHSHEAARSLTEAAGLLPARGFCGEHVPIWHALARAQLAAGNPGEAQGWLEKVTRSTTERLCWPAEYVRSFELLGRVHAAAGRVDEAVAAYEEFLAYWGKADLAQADQEEARQYLHVHRNAGEPAQASTDTRKGRARGEDEAP